MAALAGEIERYMQEKGVVGVSIAIAHNGQIVYENGFGYADLEHQVPAKAETVYRIASLSKPLTATGVMHFVQAGRIRLDNDIRRHVQEFPQKQHPFTVRQVLSHTAGIRHYRQGEQFSTRPYSGVAESLDRFKDDPLISRPGDRFTYSTYAYQIAARLIENASGMRFPQYMEQHVFRPAGMMNTSIENQAIIVPNRARGYRQLEDGRVVNSIYDDLSYKWGGGGMVSTAPDLCRFGMALLEGRLLNREFVDQMWRSQQLNDGSLTGYGLGFYVRGERGRRIVSHTGSQPQVRTALLIWPDEQVVIAVLTNYESHNVSDLVKRISATYFGDPLE
jgi:serine beta-lactamase-like protein LACTB, mitochondrial